jgi:DNA-binding transcriptional LysR family regulator
MPQALRELRRQHPQVALRMEVGNWVQLLESLRTESIEFFAADVRDMPKDAALDIQLIGGQPPNLYVRAGHPLAGREHTLREVWTYGLAVPKLLSPSKVELAALLGLPEGQEAAIALECDNYSVLKTIALTTDTVLGATDAAVSEELESGTLIRLVVQGWLSPPSSTGIVRLRGRTSSPAAQAAITAIVRAAGAINV